MKATQLLKKDHTTVKRLFTEFNRTTTRAVKRRRELVDRIDAELDVHARIEEEIFYPAVSKLEGTRHLLEEARDEHQTARDLLAEVRQLDPGDKALTDRMKELRSAVLHHATEEEKEMFPRAAELGADRLTDLADALQSRKQQLMQERMPDARRRGRRRAA
jgi:hemerythrin superfamily protein